MAITPTVTTLGSNAAAGTVTTSAVTVSSTVALGTPIFAVGLSGNASGASHTMSDARGSVWTKNFFYVDGVNGTELSLHSARTAGDLVAATDAATLTCAPAAQNPLLLLFAVTGSGIMLPPTIDVTSPAAVNIGHSLSATPGSTVPKQPGLLGINVVASITGATATAPAGWTKRFDVQDSGGFASVVVSTLNNLTTDDAALNPATALSISSDWYDILALYQSPPGRMYGPYGRRQGFSWK